MLQGLLANRVTGPFSWELVAGRWEEIVERFPANMLPRMLEGVRGLCTPPALADAVTRFVEGHPLPAGGKTVEQILERLAVNVAFATREAPTLHANLATGAGLEPKPRSTD